MVKKPQNLNSRVFSHPEIGDILIRKRAGSVAIRISVHPERGVKVTIPYFTTFYSAVKFITEKQDWILSSMKRQKEKSAAREIPLGEGNIIRTINREIRFEETPQANRIKILRKENHTIINHPEDISREALSAAVIKELRREAAIYLPGRTEALARLYGFAYNTVFLKNNRTNWGSCSRLNNINLNIHLMRLDAEMADFVILHELCHLKHRNHGAGFHRLLDKLCDGREKEFSARLRKEFPGAL
jgi:predicted metal-dependent hydrolase